MKPKNKLSIAILATDGFEESELSEPRNALKDAGMIAHIVSPKQDQIRAWKHTEWSSEYKVDVPLDEADTENYDALLLPGGVLNPDQLRTEEKAIQFIRDFIESDKPVAAICHGPQLLIEADVVDGLKMTSYHAIKTDLKNAGANWVDEEVVIDRNIITSRNPDDIPAFNKAMIHEFQKTKPKETA
ncbi:type 1 glutamine amidotransferase [Rhodohalobacter sp. SW132]|uniref:type 1 glutamine amidotransferase domain-containing protein n=1 Tax=Rhodohalobacter sp. SW132 TaxID=2293433 RepID=UPI000E253E22|nr:type 1 glutamine amidotransferase domain-containing protein [Rhodohalobacter sp. SW132]REL33294.1 type 1 glutamine amidotransferase [Rhodohalobacter sp. SW132]